jgi:SAM-dependent methyltransferase
MHKKEKVREHIQKNYAAVALKQGADGGCCSSGCGCGTSTVSLLDASALIGYSADELSQAPEGSNMALGCGNPTAIAALKPGEVVLDLGSGGGFDCFLAQSKVGETGYVIGVDMTPDMVRLARKNAHEAGFDNMDFRLGEIEHLPVADASVDVIISNCVINLSVDKQQVFKDAYRVLKPGGRIAASDVVATAVIPESMREDLRLVASCISGAEYVEDLRVIMEKAGFKEIRLVPKDNSRELISSWAPGHKAEDFVASYLIEAVK